MQTTTPLQKEAPKTADTTGGKATTNPLRRKSIGEADGALHINPLQPKQAAGNPLQLQKGKAAAPQQNTNLIIQRKLMEDFVTEQRELEKQKNFNGNYTTVGLEWNIAQMDERNYPFKGMSHIELAESTARVNGIKHKLETESGSRIEYVAPPFFVRNKIQGSTEPNHAKLAELIDAQHNALGRLLNGKTTLGSLLGGWPQFQTFMNAIPKLEDTISSRHWSAYTERTEQDLKSGLQNQSLDWKKAAISNILLNLKGDYQINVATDAPTYETTTENTRGRLDDAGAKFTIDTDELYNELEKNFPSNCTSTEAEELKLFNKQFARVFRQQYVVPLLKELREKQESYAKDNEVLKKEGFQDRFITLGKKTSFVKDEPAVWLKTDLLTYGLKLFTSPTLWAKELQIVNKSMLGLSAIFKKKFKSEDAWLAAVSMLYMLRDRIEIVLLLGKDRSLELMNKKPTELFDHNSLMMGVRQDTFIPSAPLETLKQDLQIGTGGLSVMEIRNTEDYMTYLKEKQQ